MYRIRRALLLTFLLTLAHAGVWVLMHPAQTAPDISGPIDGVAFSAYGRWQAPQTGQAAPRRDADLRNDLQQVRQLTGHVRTYSVDEWPSLPAQARQADLSVTLGVWLGEDKARNQREQDSAIAFASTADSVVALMVGNETQLQNRISKTALIDALKRTRASVRQPVSTAEPWHVWLEHPDLSDHVDFITVHLLPYWENIAADDAVNVVYDRYRQIQDRFPGKAVVIGETGWPSAGPARGAARADPAAQARFVRHFLSRQSELQRPAQWPALPRYFLMEAIDQPWKISIEGQAGAHWGLLDANRHEKFRLQGPVSPDPLWPQTAFLSCLFGALACLLLLGRLPHLRKRARLLLGVTLQALGAGAALMLLQPASVYLTPLALMVWSLLLIPSGLMVLVLIAHLLEFADTFWDDHLRQRARPLAWSSDSEHPLVSIHVACSNEPPAMVIDTLRSLMALEWPRLEIIIIDNNTRDASCWQPVRDFVVQFEKSDNCDSTACTDRLRTLYPDAGYVEAHVRQHGAVRLVFAHLAHLDGFKAGALNVALQLTNADAAWIGVVDADYTVRPDWIRAVAGHFAQASVDIIQSPQSHRLEQSSAFQRMVNAEYDSFFRIGMHHRHERNAIIQHGTMTLIRAQALRETGAWNTACICEDTELGLRILAKGSRALYIDQPMGAGLLPADSHAYLRQRYRWACGAMQILRTHWRTLISGAKHTPLKGEAPYLTPAQRYHFIAGWLPWWGDTLHLFMTIAALAWSLGMLIAPVSFNAPAPLFMAPPLVLLTYRLIIGPLLYRRKVGGTWLDWGGAAIAGMALSHPVARGVLSGLLQRSTPFEITKKAAPIAGNQREALQFTASETNALVTPAIRTDASKSGSQQHTASQRAEARNEARSEANAKVKPDNRPTQPFVEEYGLLSALMLVSGLLALQPELPGADILSQRAWLAMLGLQGLPYASRLLLDLLSTRR